MTMYDDGYEVRYFSDEEGSCFAEHPELPGCVADGKTKEEALQSLRFARELWIESRRAANLEVPERRVVFPVICRICQTRFELIFPESAYQRWQEGALIQRALPMLSAADRELLINGVCGSCFEELFQEGEEG